MIYYSDTEQLVLGSMFGPLTNRTHIASCLDRLVDEHFFVPGHRTILRVIREAFVAGADLTHHATVLTELRTRGLEGEVGGAGKLFELIEAAGSGHIALAHIPMLERARQGREWERLREQGDLSDDGIEAIATQAQHLAASTAPATPPQPIDAAIGDFFHALEQDKPVIQSVPIPLPTINEFLGGLARRRLVVIGGRTGTGKSSLGLQFAAHVALLGAKTLFVSLEMSVAELTAKLIGMRANTAIFNVYQPLDWNQLLKVQAEAQGEPLLIDESRDAAFERIRTRIDIAAGILGGLDLVVVDYLQLVRGKGENRTQEVGQVARGLKELARNRDCCVLALSQLSRLHEQQGQTVRKPRLADLREAGDIEHAADQVILLHRGETNNVDTIPTEILIAKNRHGKTGKIDATFIASHSRFEE